MWMGPSSRYKVKSNNFFAGGPIDTNVGSHPYIGEGLILARCELQYITLWKAPIYVNGALKSV